MGSTNWLWFVAELPIHKAFRRPDSPPEATQVTDQVGRLLRLLSTRNRTAAEIMKELRLAHRPTFRENYLRPALERRLVEMTIPDEPNSRLQQYRLTAAGRAALGARKNKS